MKSEQEIRTYILERISLLKDDLNFVEFEDAIYSRGGIYELESFLQFLRGDFDE